MRQQAAARLSAFSISGRGLGPSCCGCCCCYLNCSACCCLAIRVVRIRRAAHKWPTTESILALGIPQEQALIAAQQDLLQHVQQAGTVVDRYADASILIWIAAIYNSRIIFNNVKKERF